jgi:hypothetical protein
MPKEQTIQLSDSEIKQFSKEEIQMANKYMYNLKHPYP